MTALQDKSSTRAKSSGTNGPKKSCAYDQRQKQHGMWKDRDEPGDELDEIVETFCNHDDLVHPVCALRV